MNNAKQRRRQQRAAQFGTPGTGEYRTKDEARPQDNRAGREWDSQATTKADERELESVKRDDATPHDRSAPGGGDTKATDQPVQGRTPGREWDSERKPMSSGHKGDVRDTVGGISPEQTGRKGGKK